MKNDIKIQATYTLGWVLLKGWVIYFNNKRFLISRVIFFICRSSRLPIFLRFITFFRCQLRLAQASVPAYI